jgi:hypothetical protein
MPEQWEARHGPWWVIRAPGAAAVSICRLDRSFQILALNGFQFNLPLRRDDQDEQHDQKIGIHFSASFPQ